MKTLSHRRRSAWAVCVLALVCFCATAALPGAIAERGPVRRALPVARAETEARVIVKYKAESTLMRALAASSAAAAAPQHAQALSARLGLALRDGRPIGAHAQVLKGQGLSSRALADRLAAQADVEYAEVDERKYALAAPNDPLYPNNQGTATPVTGQWYLRAPTSATIVDATSVVSAIDAEAAWAITTGSSAIVVAVLDTGVRFDHPDLASKLLAGYDFIHDSRTANDGDAADGDASDPGDYVTTADVNVVPGCTSDHVGNSSWHGTQTAGLIGAATNNGIGMAGAGRDVMLLPLRVLGKCGGYDSDIQAAMLWAAGLSTVPTANPNPAKVVNLSLGSTAACTQSYKDVVAQLNAKGVVVVAAAGNEGLAVGSPASCPGVIAVAGLRHSGTKVGYSDLGSEVAISAPAGNCVNPPGLPCLFPLLTTSNKGTTTPVTNAAGGSIYTGGGADASLGTSFSAPLVSGTVGLMLSANPSLTPAQVLSYLKSSARAFPTTGAGAGVSACTAPTATAQNTECYCTTSTCGAGMLDSGAAVALAASGVAVANIVAPTAVNVGGSFALSGASSRASAVNATVQSYGWSILAGSSIASISSATNGSTATVITSAAGTVVVGLTVSDSAGKTATATVTLTVAPPTTADIVPSASSVVVGASVSLDGTASQGSFGNSIASYRWAITGGTTLASFSGPTNASTATLLTSAPGDVTVSLTVTDSAGQTASTSKALVVTPVPSSSGGGALAWGWLLGWLIAVIGVRAVTPRRARD
jgi:serine protease